MLFPRVSFLTLLTSFGLISSLVVKVTNDLEIDNKAFIMRLTSVVVEKPTLCTYSCSQYTKGRSNLRKYDYRTNLCECWWGNPEEFRDSRHVAPELDSSIMLLDGKLTKFQIEKSEGDIRCFRRRLSKKQYSMRRALRLLKIYFLRVLTAAVRAKKTKQYMGPLKCAVNNLSEHFWAPFSQNNVLEWSHPLTIWK